ncbi:hypothetical protein OEG86_09250 [Hoeflea alexandrii]|uniref:hypothetical protein n=1 Tax=Hoeflea alexandrii TaxID=288436 RepID=UPI00226F7347|nr:hypothetical protein [Hoeflea alexandrii]MCY0152383.1 hypothetical protein [Hoeflea alexandrii]
MTIASAKVLTSAEGLLSHKKILVAKPLGDFAQKPEDVELCLAVHHLITQAKITHFLVTINGHTWHSPSIQTFDKERGWLFAELCSPAKPSIITVAPQFMRLLKQPFIEKEPDKQFGFDRPASAKLYLRLY